jgi:hypothetical protein
MADLLFESQVKQRVIMNESMKGFLVAIMLFNSSFSMGNIVSTKEKVLVEHIFPYQPREIWAVIGQFCSIKEWQSLVEDCFIEQEAVTYGEVAKKILEAKGKPVNFVSMTPAQAK